MLFLSVSGMFKMMLRILLNVLPCSGFVKKSLSMFVVGQNATLTSPFIFCLLRKSTICLCGVFSLNLRICHFLLVILCSCYLGILLLLVQDILVWQKCLVHSTCPIASNSASVELLVFSFCLHEAVYVAPFPSVIYIPVWLFFSWCTMYELSTHHFGSLPGLIVRVISFVFLKYCITFVSFCSHQCLAALPWYIGKLLPFVCLVLYICLSIVVWLLGDGTTAPCCCLFSYILGQC